MTYDPDNADTDAQMTEQARSTMIMTAHYLNTPAELAIDYQRDHLLLLEQVFEIMRVLRVANTHESDAVQRSYNERVATDHLEAIMQLIARETAEFFN